MNYLRLFLIALFFASGPIALSSAQNGILFKQISRSDPVTVLSESEKSQLGDPFFNLVLKDNPGERSLSAIQDMIQPTKSDRFIFVVAERIAANNNRSARTVLSYLIENNGEKTDADVMLSTSLNSEGFEDNQSFLEAWGWDNHRGVYNYYRLDTNTTGTPTWKFKGSSGGVDQLSPNQRKGTCFECHTNGAPLMKELLLPWNNWFSFKFKPGYLDPDFITPQSWPVLRDPDFRNALKGAEILETQIISAISRFNRQRLNDVLKRDDTTGNRALDKNGRGRVIEARRILKPLFEPTEANFISSDDNSGTHPFLPSNQFVRENPIDLPPSFFVNSDLISGGGIAGLTGLQLPSARDFKNVKGPTQSENRALLEEFGIRFANQLPGDTLFGWLVPERSFIDNHLVDLMIDENVLSRHFVAAALRVDFTHPVFSKARIGLQKFLPEQFDFHPDGSGADELTKAVIENIESANPPTDSPAAEFLTALKSDDAATDLEVRIKSHLEEINSALNGTEVERREMLKTLMESAIEKREAFTENESLAPLDEFGLLFPNR